MFHKVRSFVLWHYRNMRHTCACCGQKGIYGTHQMHGRIGRRTGTFYLCWTHYHS